MKKIIIALSILTVWLTGCSGTSNTVNPTSTQFSEKILPLLQEKFVPLLTKDTGVRLDSWENLIKGSDQGQLLIPFDAQNSLLVQLASKSDVVTTTELDLVKAWINDGATNDKGEVPYANSNNLIYVCNEASSMVFVVDADANVVVRTIDLQKLGFSGNAKPHYVAVEKDGSYWYLSLIGESKVLKFNRKNELMGSANFETPGLLKIHPTKDLLFVGRSMKAVNPPQRIGIVKRSNMDIDELDVFFPRPHAITTDISGDHVFSASLAENRMISIDTETENVELMTVPGPTHTFVQFAASPNGKMLVVGGQFSNTLMFFDISDPTKPKLTKSIPVEAAPWHPVFSPDGKYVYFGNKTANAVTIVNMETESVEAVIKGEGIIEPHGIALAANGKYLYVSGNNLQGDYKPRYDLGNNAKPGVLAVIDLSQRKVVKVLEMRENASGVGYRYSIY